MLKTLIGRSAESRTRRIFLALCIVLGFLQGWAARGTIVNDTVSYLDIGDFLWHGHWSLVVNGLWNPLDAAILGAAVRLVRPSFQWEYPLVHLVVFLIYLLTLWCYDFFLRQLIGLKREMELPGEQSVPPWVWVCIGYTLFLWSSLRLIGVDETNPDMLVAAFFYLAAGLLVAIRRGAAGWKSYCALGLALGLGYLTKSVMFPVSMACMAAGLVMGRREMRRVLASIAVFAAVAGPYIVALSVQKGHITTGESGTYNYAVHVDGLPACHWQGGTTEDDGSPIHPSRELVSRPGTYEFGTPIGGVYPAWTDPTYWYEGMLARFHLHRQIARSLILLRSEQVFLFDLHGSMLTGIFVMLYATGRKWAVAKDAAGYWFLLLPCLTALGLYAMVHVEPRYLAPFLDTLVLTLFISARLSASEGARRICAAVALLLVMMYFLPVGESSIHLTGFVRDVLRKSKPDPDVPAEVVQGMYGLGLKPGDEIASLQWSLYNVSTWARLARVKIVAEVYYWPGRRETDGNNFWAADPASQQRVMGALAGTGARFIVSQTVPEGGYPAGWQRVGDSDYYAYRIDRPGAPSAQR